MRTIRLPAIERSVSLSTYMAAIRLAKADLSVTFKHGLTTWWPTTGAEIMQQFCDGMTVRVNQAIPYTQRGQAPETLKAQMHHAKQIEMFA